MPTKSPQDQQSDDLKELKEIVSQMHESIDREIHKPFWKKALSEFASGLVRGVGLIVGTTIVAAAVIYALQTIIDWSHIQTSITDWVGQTAQEGVENVMPDMSSFIR